MRQYIYTNRTNSKIISIHEFIDKLLVKNNLENIHEQEPLQGNDSPHLVTIFTKFRSGSTR